MSNNQNSNNQNNNNQNQQQGGLLNRVNNGNNNQNQQQNNQNNNNSLRSRFGNNNNRFGNNNASAKPTWTITPMGKAGVRIAFEGIGDPLFRILGTPLDTKMNDVTVLAERIEEDDVLREELIDKLDEAWKSYGIGGAIIMHPVRKKYSRCFCDGSDAHSRARATRR